jgi:hypothetical protein
MGVPPIAVFIGVINTDGEGTVNDVKRVGKWEAFSVQGTSANSWLRRSSFCKLDTRTYYRKRHPFNISFEQEWQCSGMDRSGIKKFTDVSEVRTADVIRALVTEAINTSESSVNFYETQDLRRHLHTSRCENLKSHRSGITRLSRILHS